MGDFGGIDPLGSRSAFLLAVTVHTEDSTVISILILKLRILRIHNIQRVSNQYIIANDIYEEE